MVSLPSPPWMFSVPVVALPPEIVSSPAPPLIRLEPEPTTMVSLPSPPETLFRPLPPLMVSAPSPPEMKSELRLPLMTSSPGPAVDEVAAGSLPVMVLVAVVAGDIVSPGARWR